MADNYDNLFVNVKRGTFGRKRMFEDDELYIKYGLIETTKPVSEEGWAEKLYNELSIIYGLYCDDWDLNDSSRSADVLHDYQTRNIP